MSVLCYNSRRGHIPTMLLLVEGLVLMLVAWFAFLSEGGDLAETSAPILATLDELSYQDAYVHVISRQLAAGALRDVSSRESNDDFMLAFAEAFEKRAAVVAGMRQHPTNFFAHIREGAYTIVPDGNNYILTVSNVFVSSQVGQHAFTRTFDITVNFDESSLLPSQDLIE